MQEKIFPSDVRGEVSAPPSKSCTQRALAAALLHRGATVIANAGDSDDEKAALAIIQRLGAQVTRADQTLHIQSQFPSGAVEPKTIHCGESGLAARLFTPLAALSPAEINISAEGTLAKRSMNFFADVLPQLGVNFHSAQSGFPLVVTGPLQPKDITVSGARSSQFLTGLLFAYGAAATNAVTITVTHLKSRPYIDLTLSIMEKFGYRIANDKYERFTITPAARTNETIYYRSEGDWSGAAFLCVAGALTGAITISELDTQSAQADKAIIDVLRQCGANVSTKNNSVTLEKNELRCFSFDATDAPDLFPPLAALAVHCSGRTEIKGVSRLAGKESNRGEALIQIFDVLGADIFIENDSMIIDGGKKLRGGKVSSHYDHRIAMAAAVAALNGEDALVVDNAEVVAKSYPRFFDDLRSAGAKIEKIET